ncbi:putative aliphatic sulfonates transport permease protein SsuC [Andreprevotia sp. IGB-42]|uniref:ABC transporter permease n=1 Tax=Andreprevotia sp. IGB-42 TaxID=2497473 RepID=UPI00135BFB78|nr:ABC transporter permease [Andreprevotia sp. IGB-42]KAF0815127.1 putative aliphatic sulfonates transport permease protein SsuC [Andreprevotia sp. IGB-42]
MSIASSENTAVLPRPLPATQPSAALGNWLANAGTKLTLAAVGLLLPLALLALWQHAVDKHWLAVQILPPPKLVWESLLDLWQAGDLQSHLAISLSRIGWSCLIGIGGGLVLGLSIGLSRTVKAYVYPTFEVVSQFPVVGWIPLLIIFVGIDEALKISAISLAVIVPVTVHTYKGIANIPRSLLDVARVYRYSFAQVVWRVVLPSALPSLFSGIRQGVMQAWLSLVFVELLASSEGIGYLMVWGRQLLQLDLVIVGMIVIGAVGVVLDLSLRLIESRLQTWRRGAF